METPAVDAPKTPPPIRLPVAVQTLIADGDLVGWVRAKGGRVQTSMRRLAQELGRSPAGVHIEIGRLAAADVLTAMPSAHGTALTLAATGSLN